MKCELVNWIKNEWACTNPCENQYQKQECQKIGKLCQTYAHEPKFVSSETVLTEKTKGTMNFRCLRQIKYYF